LVENCEIFIPHLYLATLLGVTPSEFCKDVDGGKTRMIMVKNYDDMLSRFHLMPERHGQTDRIAISISRVSVLTRDKNVTKFLGYRRPVLSVGN